MTTPKLPPHNLEAEEAVNGSLLIDGRAIYQVVLLLKPEDFLMKLTELSTRHVFRFIAGAKQLTR